MSAPESRQVDAARAALLADAQSLTIAELAAATHRRPSTTRQWVSRHRASKRLIAVTDAGKLRIPGFQLDEDLNIDPTASAVVNRLLTYGLQPWAVWDWFFAANTWLGNARPVDVLQRRPDDVHTAVDGLTQ